MYAENTSVQDDVLAVLGLLAKQKTSLRLTKPFRGITLTQEVKILDVNQERAVFQVSDIKIFAALEGQVHLHSQVFSRPVTARLRDLSIGEGRFVLSDFAYIHGDWKERLHERVRPKNPTYISLQCKRKSLRVSLETISVNGMGVLACKVIVRDMKVQPPSNVRLDFKLPPDYNWIDLKGKIVRSHEIGRTLASAGIQLHPNAKQARSLETYIDQRKKEIVEELDQAYFAASQPRGVEWQYF
jgi:hypothetical protein